MGGLAGSGAIGIGDAVWRIGADLSNLHRQLGEAQKAVGQTMQNVGRQAQQIGKAFTVAGGAITGTLGLMTRSFLKTGDELDKMSRRTGVSVEALSELSFVLEQNGSNLDEFEVGLRRMQRSLIDAEDGTGRAADVMQRLGLNVQDVVALSPEEQFITLAQALSEVEDATLQSALAQDIFGRSGTNLLPTIQQGADGITVLRDRARELGLTWDQEAAEGAASFKDSIDALRSAFEPLTRIIAQTVVDALEPWVEKAQDIVQRIRAWMEENEELVATIVKITGAVGALLLGLGPLLVIFGTLISALGGIVSAGVAASSVGLIPLIAVFAAVGVAATALYFLIRDNWEFIRDTTIRIFTAVKNWIIENWDLITEYYVQLFRVWRRIFSMAFDAVVNVIRAAWALAKPILEAFGFEFEDMGDTATGALEMVVFALEKFADYLDWLAPKVNAFADFMVRQFERIGRVVGVLQYANIPLQIGRQFFASGGRVGQQANIIAGEEGPELADLPGGRRVLLGSYGPGMYRVPIGTYIHKFSDTMKMLASGVPFAGMYASGGTVQTVGYLEKIRDILSRLRVLGMARLPRQDQNDFWRASQEAWLRARQAINPVVHQDTFGFGARDGRSYAGALQGSGGWLRASQRQGAGGMLTEMFRFARGGRVTPTMATAAGVVVNVNMAEMVIREEADIDRISEQIAARVNRIVRQL